MGILAHDVPYILHLEGELGLLLPELEQLAVRVVGMKCGGKSLGEVGIVVVAEE